MVIRISLCILLSEDMLAGIPTTNEDSSSRTFHHADELKILRNFEKFPG
jgi:hypothetical protein